MARLNEPEVAPDGLEILRRKFIRQNRDIARTNSTQSLRIRGLENECARMLSENLDLRGQILRLETELQENRAQRVADHAMEIKEKMEAQLLEWGTMLASLGHEPIPKNRSPRAAKKARRDPSMGLAGAGSPRFRRRNTIELEAAAIHEGRLAPLWENKPCPRETLNRDEILALCSEAAETDSPDLGPPPVSRFVNEEPVKIDLPTRALTEVTSTTSAEEPFSRPLPSSSPERITETRQDEDTVSDQPEIAITRTRPNTILELSPPKPQVANTNLKRKLREDDEKENAPMVRLGGDPIKGAKAQPEKTASRPSNRPVKNLPLVKKDVLEKTPTLNPSAASRKPLGVKNVNEVVHSPKKVAQKPMLDETARAKAEIKAHERARDKAKPKKKEENLRTITVPALEQAAAPAPIVQIDPETFSGEPLSSVPSSPVSAIHREEMLDTPPPVDISSEGETSRGGRRARSNVSYAEPNLRDKMRRPTKQLFDAVAGEGKAIRRTSQSKPNEISSVKSEEKSSGWNTLPSKMFSDSERTDDATASPLVQKVSRASPLQRITASSASKPASGAMNQNQEDMAAKEVIATGGLDIYEFTSSSPNNKKSTEETRSEEGKRTSNSRGGKSKILSSLLREDLVLGTSETHGKGRGSKKRASMMAQKSTSGLDPDTSANADGDGSFNSNSSGDTEVAARGVSMRRRSMML